MLSEEDCNLILNKYFNNENFKILNYKIDPFSNATEGFLGEHYELKIEVSKNEKIKLISFFVKQPPYKQELQMEFVTTSLAFEKEILFYDNLAKKFKSCSSQFYSCIPQYYFSKLDKIVVLENLQEKNFKPATQEVLDVKHIEMVLKTLAKLHGACIIYEESMSKKLGKTFQLTDKYGDYLKESYFKNDENYLGFKANIASLKGIMFIIDMMEDSSEEKENLKRKFQEFSEKCFEIVCPTNKFRNVLCHGDLWLKNILFRYESDEPTECKIVDFQFINYNPPVFDVLKLIYQSTTLEMRKQHFESFLTFYYNQLQNELTESGIDASLVLSLEQFRSSVQYMLPHCLVETSYYYSFHKIGDNVLESLMDNPESFKKFAFYDRSPYVAKYYKTGSNYKMWLDEILLEIKNMDP